MSLNCPLRQPKIFLGHIAWYYERKRCDIIPAMSQQHIPASVDKSVAIADVPVKITFLHGDETLQEYEDIIDLKFDTKTAAGRELGKRMAILTMREGLSTEEALFK